MAQEWSLVQSDQRNFGTMQTRLLDDLNRPDLSQFAPTYIQDAIRFYSRKPFFFSEMDNTSVPFWGNAPATGTPTPNLIYTQGATITDVASDNNQYVFVNLIAGTADATRPVFTPILYAPAAQSSPPVFNPTSAGTTVDGGCLWATVAPWRPGIWTQLATVPFQNQYVPPIDYIAPRIVEVTWAGSMRIGMTKITYKELREYDVIRYSPPTTYPTWWAWFQQQIYFWPYPVGFYPITLSYTTAPALPRTATDVNFWTTQAEALIRYEAAARICWAVLGDMEGAQRYYLLAGREMSILMSQQTQQHSTQGIPPDVW